MDLRPPPFSASEPPLRGLTGDRLTVVLFGDSLTQRGFGEGGWCGALAHFFQRKADIYNRGYGGYNTRWARYLVPYIFPLSEDTVSAASQHLLVAVWFGANDAAAPSERVHVPLDEYEDNLRAILRHVKRAARQVILLTPPPVHEPSRLKFQKEKYGAGATGVAERTTEAAGRYAAVAARIAKELDVECIDIWSLMIAHSDPSKNLKPGDAWPAFVGANQEGGDGLHFSASGQAFVANALLGALRGGGNVHGLVSIDEIPTELPLGSAVNAEDFMGSFLDHQIKARSALIAYGFGNGHGRHSSSGQALTASYSSVPWAVPVFSFFAGAAIASMILRGPSLISSAAKGISKRRAN
mmetsp:Transcript_61536/g.120817  ORF Transcript_61536/g.120817 Transcript_61536/m.120817 type:complete len:354 (+) Transcript_61536:10-1071(+)